ncbi:hypothetical protein KK083_26360 [Fulvivirgaceae bacterium PWU4]|uniref:Uncharacterized protein n=1 Tax=Chryseosolibacter histidini TaxID=2782349 RepID=A0AAP2DSD4_9BACT|nr:hypothetical protein [Chryseosolibacter histidini]MBT1700438.1 hypothetical protein [Chryseosolibacter histidini]
MNFYSLKLKLWDDSEIDRKSESPRVYPQANGGKIFNARGFLGINGKIHMTDYVDETPVFDYFYLYNLSSQREDDWILLDAYAFAGQNYPLIRGFLISEKFRQVLLSCKIADPSRFYKSKLMYKGEKIDYYIFHLAQDEWMNFHSHESAFYFDDKRIDVLIDSNASLKNLISDAKNQQKDLSMNLVLKDYADIFFFSQFNYVVSEMLKQKMESEGLKGISFTYLENVNFQFKFSA